MERKITVSLSFDFYPDGEHNFLFEGMNEADIVRDAVRMTTDDIYTLSNSNDIYRQLSVEITQEEDSE